MKKERKIPKEMRKFVLENARECADIIGVTNFTVDIFYMADPKQSDTDLQTHGEINVDRRYLKASIKLYPHVEENWRKGEKEKVKDVIFHEVSHILTQHFYDVATSIYKDEGETKDAWEMLTEAVSKLALRIDGLT